MSPFHQSWGGSFFFDKRSHNPRRGGLAAPEVKVQRSSSVVTLLRQVTTHHLTPIDRPGWSTGRKQRSDRLISSWEKGQQAAAHLGRLPPSHVALRLKEKPIEQCLRPRSKTAESFLRKAREVETKGCQLCKAHPPETELILISSGRGCGTNRFDMQDRHTEVRPTSKLLVTLCLSSFSHHRRFQWASQCPKRRVSSINDEFTE